MVFMGRVESWEEEEELDIVEDEERRRKINMLRGKGIERRGKMKELGS